ncbi:isoprenylcysteine carboxylmethyltransferase family protein [Thalassotalea sp. Y01]|uniref:methyltransferase family protein n=1 Tax=Thalassotalea sp. Y01 TaxID=2729613 RepID=UPI00145F251E|nr:isoprenylcysteine carboxylmethyltransferase family protein [Thalassotalea sp. Y01]NMP15982.1 isoprenylcysteine carboxylmethyltransferase family protein [Thalassotalea sp. Y01]
MLEKLELKVPPLLLVIIFLLGIYLLPHSPIFIGPEVHWLHITGLALTAIAVLLVLFAVFGFSKEKTTVDPMHPDKTDALVVKGVYRISRNPMYLGFLLLIVALGLALNTLWLFPLAIVFILYINRLQIVPEERFLQQKFGDAFTFYCQKVRRWI